MGTRIDVERFDGNCDFGIWRCIIYDGLVQQKVTKDLGGLERLPESLSEEQKLEHMELIGFQQIDSTS